jgi:extracellular elastinolytic metalloproteinase
MRKNVLLLISSLLCAYSYAQNNESNPSEIALTYLNANQQLWNLEAADIAQMRVTDSYQSRHIGVTHVYFVQQYRGNDVYGATYNANIQDDEVLIAFQSLVPDIASKIIAGSVQVTAEQAVFKTIERSGSAVRGILTIKERIDKNTMVFNKGQNSYLDMPVRLVYAQLPSGYYVLAWDITIEPKSGADMVNIRIDAASGEVIDEVSLSVHCSFPDHFLGRQHECDDEASIRVSKSQVTVLPAEGAQYNVIPIPFESPNHIDRRLVTNPADEVASPFGWHDQDGVEGAEQTITFGNNVHAFVDRDGDYVANETVTDGGAELHFDFPFDQSKEPVDYQEAATSNLFYMNNILHDLTYNYGLDEVSGNFQFKNYSGTGLDGDHVIAQSQFGADTDDPPYNNATFSTPPDGGNGRMLMYLWTGAGANQLLNVKEPGAVAGTYNTATTSDWGAAITNVPLTAEVIIVDDGTGNPTQACNALTNGDDLDGKIALIDRGSCEFGLKALNAQDAGAIGFIICNFEEGLVTMAGGAVGTQVNIPGIFIANSDCQKIRVHAGNGLVVSFVNQSDTTVAQRRAGSFDNGIIAHEYGHGISNRLTGGPSRAGCLQNFENNGATDGEQMGEGWSDYFGLILTVKPNDDGSKVRGVGTYATNRDTNSVGIRPFPYTTDMNINPMTYDDIAFFSVPHGVGTVWCTMIWDLYWALSDEYGWDEDLYRGTGGNNLAIQLVMDGMKMQPCNPGFVDGRDAILEADTALTGGENGRLIWEVFARRGLGYSADQGAQGRRLDGTEAFDVYPLAIKELKLAKKMTPMIKAGEEIAVLLSVANHKTEEVTGVSLSDLIPEGSDIIGSSASHAYTREGDLLVFDLGNIPAGQTIEVSYRLETEPNLVSERFFFDDMEQGELNWDILLDEGDEFWQLQGAEVYSGDNAWLIPNVDTSSDVSLLFLNAVEISGEKPVLNFYHKYATEKFFDGGILQVSKDDGFSWINMLEEDIIRNGYAGKVPFSLFAIPRSRAWHGDSEGWVATMVDLSDYTGENVILRWRFGSDGNTSDQGWFIDDVEVMDAITYNSEACVTSEGGDEACAIAPEWGTVVESGIVSAVKDIAKDETGIKAYPNPAFDQLTVEITSKKTQYLTIELVSGTGQTVWATNAAVSGNYITQIETASLARGFYFIRATNESENQVLKVILQ